MSIKQSFLPKQNVSSCALVDVLSTAIQFYCPVNTCMYCHIQAYTSIYYHLRTDVFARIWYVFGVRICPYPCQYLHVLNVFARINGTENCQSHRYVQIRAIRKDIAKYDQDTDQIRTKYLQLHTKYVQFFWGQKKYVFIFDVHIASICTYLVSILYVYFVNIPQYVHIRTRSYMFVYVCIQPYLVVSGVCGSCFDCKCSYLYVSSLYVRIICIRTYLHVLYVFVRIDVSVSIIRIGMYLSYLDVLYVYVRILVYACIYQYMHVHVSICMYVCTCTY